MPLNFTLLYRDQLTNIDDAVGDRGWTPGVGELVAEPMLKDGGARIPYGVDSGFRPRTVKMYLDTDGVLKGSKGGTPGVRLDANDPLFNIPRLHYRVSAPNGLTDLQGRPVPWRPVYFDAPTTDTTLYLKAFLPVPGQRFGRGPGAWPLAGGTINVTDREVVFQNSDGSVLAPIAIPDGYVVMVDNGDGTWSVG